VATKYLLRFQLQPSSFARDPESGSTPLIKIHCKHAFEIVFSDSGIENQTQIIDETRLLNISA